MAWVYSDKGLPGKTTWELTVGGYTVSCRRQPYQRYLEVAGFNFRDVYFMVEAPCIGVVAKAEFVEWRATTPCFNLSDYVYAADAVNQEEFDSADAYWRSFEDFDNAFDYGTLVRFDRLRIQTFADVRRMAWECIRQGINREFRHRCAAMTLKAFPLEFMGKGDEVDDGVIERKQKAMHRLYRKELGVEPLVCGDSWMWKPIKAYSFPLETPRAGRAFEY